MDPVVEAVDVWLRIPVWTTETRSLKSVLVRSVTGGALVRSAIGAEVEALRGISCKICRGERVALIGHNGAGKSTFLKLVSGIYLATSGRVKITDRVFPMIQKSFITSPELSGIQAVKAHYLLINRNLRGFQSFLDDVVNFSGLGDFVHLPVKTYSEGMAARLLFAVLTGFKHECLALDEGIGAGDSQFQDKAQSRMQDFIAGTGTLIMASHSDRLLKMYCTRGIVFEQGKIAFDSNLETALSFYHEHHSAGSH
jgi:lipopolysaccharide transport system ATP-binding protein